MTDCEVEVENYLSNDDFLPIEDYEKYDSTDEEICLCDNQCAHDVPIEESTLHLFDEDTSVKKNIFC